MESFGERVVDRLTNTRKGERTVALLMFAYSFLAMTSHNILKPVTKSKFIDQLGSDNLPYVLRGKLAGGVFGTMRFVDTGKLSLPTSTTGTW